MDAAIIATYRCNARCRMCRTWEFPTKPSEEFEPDLLRKLPNGLGRVNITGGEPLIRQDLPEIVDILAPKAERLEISTNDYFTGFPEPGTYAQGTFDAVTLLNVLEHVVWPVELLRSVEVVLDSSGIVVTRVPNVSVHLSLARAVGSQGSVAGISASVTTSTSSREPPSSTRCSKVALHGWISSLERRPWPSRATNPHRIGSGRCPRSANASTRGWGT